VLWKERTEAEAPAEGTKAGREIPRAAMNPALEEKAEAEEAEAKKVVRRVLENFIVQARSMLRIRVVLKLVSNEKEKKCPRTSSSITGTCDVLSVCSV